MAISIGFRNVEEIATPACALVRNDTAFYCGITLSFFVRRGRKNFRVYVGIDPLTFGKEGGIILNG